MAKVCIVGSADSLTGKGLGKVIDSHDIIIRINQPQISGFEEDAGSRVTHCYISPWQIIGWAPKGNVCGLCDSKIENKKRDQLRKLRKQSIIKEDCFHKLKLEDRKMIVLQAHPNGLNYDFHSFYKEISYLIDDNVNFSFINTLDGGMKKWRKRGFSRIPTSGTQLVEYYRRIHGNIDIVGFGHPLTGRKDKFYHYSDVDKLHSISNDPHDMNIDIVWLNKLHNKHKIRILELDESNNTI